MTITKEGAIASFYTVNKAPIKHLKVYFSPKQVGEGTPSSENIRPIEGWDRFTLSCSNKGLVKFGSVGPFASYFNGYNDQWVKYNTTTVPIVDRNSYYTYSCYIDNINGTEISQVQVWFKDITNTKYLHVSSGNGIAVGTAGWSKVTFKPSSTDFFLGLGISLKPGAIASKGTLELGNTMTEYEPYQGFTQIINWSNDAGIIYGGYIDLITGELVQEQIGKTFKGSDADQVIEYTNTTRRRFRFYKTLKGNSETKVGITYCDKLRYQYNENDTLHYFFTDNNSNGNVYAYLPKDFGDNDEITFIASLYTPELVTTLSPIELQSFIGQNNIWSNATKVKVEYDLAESNDELYRRRNIILNSSPHVESTSGTIASFDTDIKAPLKELKAYFTPIQEGSGDPSTVNIRPIHGFTKLTLHHDGKNIIDLQSATWSGDSNKVSYSISGGDVTITAKTSGRVGFVGSQYSIKQNVPYAWLGKTVYFGCSDVIHNNPEHICTVVVEFRDESGTRITDPTVITTNGEIVKARSFTIPSNTKEFAIMFRIAQNCGTVDVNAGDYVIFKDFYIRYPADTALYEPYFGETIPIEFPATKNLFNAFNYVNNPGYGFVASEGTFNVDSVGSGNACIVRMGDTFQAGTYTLSAKCSGSGLDKFRLLCSSSSCGGTWNDYYNSYFIDPPDGIDNLTFTTNESFTIGIVFVVRYQHPNEPGRIYDIQLERGSFATPYEPYGTVYRGYVDMMRGKLIATHAYMERAIADMDNTESYPGWTNSAPVSWFGEINKAVNAYTNVSTYGGWKIGVNNRYHDPGVLFLVYDHFGLTQTEWKENYPNLIVQFVLELANPIEYDLTPQQIKTLKGTNNIWSDANGNIEVKYWTH